MIHKIDAYIRATTDLEKDIKNSKSSMTAELWNRQRAIIADLTKEVEDLKRAKTFAETAKDKILRAAANLQQKAIDELDRSVASREKALLTAIRRQQKAVDKLISTVHGINSSGGFYALTRELRESLRKGETEGAKNLLRQWSPPIQGTESEVRQIDGVIAEVARSVLGKQGLKILRENSKQLVRRGATRQLLRLFPEDIKTDKEWLRSESRDLKCLGSCKWRRPDLGQSVERNRGMNWVRHGEGTDREPSLGLGPRRRK